MQVKKIKVAHIITRLIVGGAQENTLYTIEHLQKQKDIHVTLISGESLGPEGKLYEKDDFKLKRLIVNPFLTREIEPVKDLRALISLYKHFKKEKYDVVHTHSSKAGIIGRVAAFLAGIPVVIHTIHGLPYHPYEKWYKNFIYVLTEKICAKVSSKIISVCDTMTEKALKNNIGNKNQYTTIYSGMDLNRYIKKDNNNVRDRVRKKYNISDHDFVFVKIARLFELKGHDFIIDVAKDIIKKNPKVKFLFVGDGILKEHLINRIKENNLENNFIFTGLVPPQDVPDYISASDCVVHTSLREGLARVIPQGFLLKKPVVSFDIDGAKELVINDKTGYLVKSEKTDDLLRNMQDVLYNYPKAKELALNGYELCKKRYSHEKMGKDIENLYRELLLLKQ